MGEPFLKDTTVNWGEMGQWGELGQYILIEVSHLKVVFKVKVQVTPPQSHFTPPVLRYTNITQY